jgi:hypothetical protein
MCDQASIKQLALSEDLDWENLDDEGTDLTSFHSLDDSNDDEPTTITIATRTADDVTTETVLASSDTNVLQAASNEEPAAAGQTPMISNNRQATTNKTPRMSNNVQSKRLLTVSGTASSQKKKKLDPFSVMSQVSGSLQELGSTSKVNEKMYELEKKFKTEELKLKGRELALLEQKSETELNLLKIKGKKELLLAWKELKDAGVSQEDIDLMLPIA